ncbi:MAG: ATP-binding protein [Gammaproteobacteria bacterium]
MKAPLDSPSLVRVYGSENFLRVSPSFESQLGLKGRDLEERSFLDWIHPDDRESLEAVVEGRGGCVDARHETRDGGWLSFDWNVRRFRTGYAVLGRVSDTREALGSKVAPSPSRHATMAQTLDAMARIVEAQNPGMLCSILLVDAEHTKVSVGAGPSLPQAYNDAVEGLQIGPAVGSCGSSAFWNVPVIVNDISTDPLWRNLRDAAAIAGVSACWSHPVTSTNGEVLGAMALYNRKPLVPTEEQLRSLEIAARMVGLAIERDNLEDQLLQAAKLEALGVLAGGIAHDFNNLMAVVSSNAKLAMQNLPTQSTAATFLTDVLTASEAASELCDEMLTYAGKGVFATDTLECNSLVQDLGGLLRVALSRKATLVYELSGAPLHVSADETQLRQVLMNLITNASEALEEEPGRIVVSTNLIAINREDPRLVRPDGRLDPGEYVCISVTDTGSGMSQKTQARVFDPFYTTKEAGRGLGLAAAQGIVMNHGGAITLESTEGIGTTFSIVLPPATSVTELSTAVPEQQSSLASANVLLVDDHPLVRRALANLLEANGHSVICGNDGQEAIDIFSQSGDGIECIVLDYSMPKLNGIEVVAEIRKIDQEIPIILCSGYAEADLRGWASGTSVNYAIQKHEPDTLLKTVSEALNRRV